MVCQRSVTNLIQRYEELVSLQVSDRSRLNARLRAQGRVVLAIDGLQPDVGNEVLWVIRECLSGEVLLARPLLSGTETDLAALFREVLQVLPVPMASSPCAKPWPVPCQACHTNCASSITCVRLATSFLKRIGIHTPNPHTQGELDRRTGHRDITPRMSGPRHRAGRANSRP
jgi:hypothetical protein